MGALVPASAMVATISAMSTGLSAVCLPLRAADKVIGAMLITTQLPHEFMSSDIRILMALGQIGGSAIHRTSLYEQTVNQLGRLAALRTIDMAITSSLDLGLTLNVVLDQVIGQCSVDAADILLLKPELQILDFASGKGFRTHSIESASLHLGEVQVGPLEACPHELRVECDAFVPATRTVDPTAGRVSELEVVLTR